MNNNIMLDDCQRKLVSENLNIVRWVIYDKIKVSESAVCLGFDDLFGEGCLHLCRAAATYNGVRARFSTYARVVIKNGLASYCRRMNNIITATTISLDAPFNADNGPDDLGDFLTAEDDVYEQAAENETLRPLRSVKREYDETARLGIEAIELKIKGFTGADIAELYGVKPNLVGAWISRAASKLRENERFITELGR